MIIEHDSTGWALDAINDLLAQGRIDEDLARRGREAVGLLFESDTVFASIAPIDGGDLSFYWVAGKRSIEIDLFADEGIWFAYTSSEGERVLDVAPSVTKELHDALAEFSAEVNKINPEWPKLYPGYGEWMKRRDALAKLGSMVDTASWRTPKYSTYGMGFTAEQTKFYYRQNDIAVGTRLLEQLEGEPELREMIHGLA